MNMSGSYQGTNLGMLSEMRSAQLLILAVR